MTKLKKKKQPNRPELLFAENQAFLDGKLKYPVHSHLAMDRFAKKHHLSTSHNIGGRVSLAAAALAGGLITFHLCFFLYRINLEIAETSIFLLMILFLGLGLMLLLAMFMIYAGLVGVNYHPKKVKALYHKWLRRGRILHGIITSMSGDYYIHYQATLDDGSKIKGKFPIVGMGLSHAEIKDKVLVGKTIYILYADKKLHAPL